MNLESITVADEFPTGNVNDMRLRLSLAAHFFTAGLTKQQ